MTVRKNLFAPHLLLMILTTAWVSGPGRAAGPDDATVTPVILDCGANSLFVMSKVIGNPVSYAEALRLMPVTDKGNSMLDLKKALESLKVKVDAVVLDRTELAGIRVPAILLALPPAKAGELTPVRPDIGHYIVLRPVGSTDTQVLDFPREPRVISLNEWSAVNGAQRFNVLLVSWAGKVVRPALAASQPATAPSSISGTAVGAPLPRETSVVLKPGTRRSVLAQHEFGDAAEGSSITHTFVIENQYDKPISIEKTEKSCGCTEVAVREPIIRPGASTRVDVTLSLAGRFATTSVQAAVFFKSESGVPPVLLTLHGEPHSRFESSPPVIELGTIRPEQGRIPFESRIETTEFAGQSGITKVESDSAAITAGVRRVELPGKKPAWIVKGTLDSTAVAGRVAGELKLFADNQTEAAVRIGVRATVESLLTIRPTSLLLVTPSDPNAGGGTGRVVVEHRDHQVMHFVSATPVQDVAGEGGITVKEAAGQTPSGLTLDVKTIAKDPFARQVRLRLSVGDEKKEVELILPVVFAPQ